MKHGTLLRVDTNVEPLSLFRCLFYRISIFARHHDFFASVISLMAATEVYGYQMRLLWLKQAYYETDWLTDSCLIAIRTAVYCNIVLFCIKSIVLVFEITNISNTSVLEVSKCSLFWNVVHLTMCSTKIINFRWELYKFLAKFIWFRQYNWFFRVV